MNTIFPSDYQDNLKKAWPRFINNEDYDCSFIRPEILESWKRSLAAGASVDSVKNNMLSSQDLNIRINSNIKLLEVVRPYMEKLYSIVQGSDFYLLFCDKDGYILDLIGDSSLVEQGKSTSTLIVGANRQESIAGTNAIGTCLALKRPIQIWGGEHFLEPYKNYACAGAPFFDSDGNILGCLNITGLAENMHPHSLGLIISAVDGITKELHVREASKRIELISAQRNSIIQSVNAGLVLLNNSGRIIQINNTALKMLSLDYESVIGKILFDFISFNEKSNSALDFSSIADEAYNKEVSVYKTGSDARPNRFNMSVNNVISSSGELNGKVITFNESRMINKLVNDISGYRPKYTFDSIIGNSPATKDLIAECRSAAKSNANILLIGQSGTGKELLAQSIHSESDRKNDPFVAVNCAAIPKGLVESELFGYEKGAFTGANRNGNPGKFELADGGTIFLDEIGDMPIDVQATLLRVIQTREIVRIGGKFPKPINVRIIAATNKNLPEAIKKKTFREDLYYRLNVFNISIPPLKDRGDDVLMLSDYFVKQYSPDRNMVISDETYKHLLEYNWPGNIRQLENTIERAVNIAPDGIILPEHLTDEILHPTHTASESASAEFFAPRSQKGYTKADVENILRRTSGNVTEAAMLLGLSRRTMYRKLHALEINPQDFKK